MQKWCPDAFEAAGAIRASGAVAVPVFQPHDQASAQPANSAVRGFRSEAGFTDPQMLLNHLTQRERAQLFDLVEQDLSREYEEREQALRAELALKSSTMEENYRLSLESLSGELERVLAEQLKEISDGSARLAVRLAEKIVRTAVALDPEILARTMETAHYKLLDGNGLTVCLHPEDAAWLEGQPELRARLKINTINADRRLDRGGCVLKSGSQEVDATLGRQLETLAEIVEEALATAGVPDTMLTEKDTDEPQLG